MLDCEMHNFTAGHTIIQQGQINHSLYIVSQGEVSVVVSGNVVNVLSAGKEFGETSMLKGNLCNASIITAKPTACLSLNKETFEKHLRGKNKAREAMIDATGAEKLFKVKSHNRAASGMLTKEGRRGSLMRVVNVKARVSGLSASDLSDVVAPEEEVSVCCCCCTYIAHTTTTTSLTNHCYFLFFYFLFFSCFSFFFSFFP